MAPTTGRRSFAHPDPLYPLRLRALFSLKAKDDTEGRYIICLALRDKLLGHPGTQPQCFQACHSLMQEESTKFSDLMRHVTSGQVYDDHYEYDIWCHWNAKVTGRNNPRKPPPPPPPPPPTDEQWVQLVLNETKAWLSSLPPRAPGSNSNIWPTWRQYHAQQIAAFLEFGSTPNKDDAVEVYFCASTEDAANLIDSGALLVIENQQPFPWNGPPLNDCFQHLSDPECLRRLQPRDPTSNRLINTRSFEATMRDYHWITIPTRPRDTLDPNNGQVTRQSPFFRKTLQQIQKKLILGTPRNDDKWNVLTMVQWVPVPYPPFLNTPNSDILHRIDALEATGAGPTVLSGRNIEFMLLSEGGNHTASHVDDFAPSIFFTCHQGPVGIGWIPLSWQDRLKLEQEPLSFKGQARYLVLHPGQTVYMPPATIHYVFRKPSDPTLITGGEVLTWAGLRRWLCLLKHQELSETEPEVTTDKAGNWVACLIELVKQRREAQDWDNIPGGREELELVMKTLERWNHFDTINDFFEFLGCDMNNFQ